MAQIAEAFHSSTIPTIYLRFEEPNQCPLCNKSIKPYFLFGWINEENLSAYATFECHSCFNAFIKNITGISKANKLVGGYTTYQEDDSSNSFIAPSKPVPVEFSEYITTISPQFANIYNQANAAECYNLNEIAGIGYRKSVEFLIKDYLTSKLDDETEKDKIKGKLLANCINDNIDLKSLKMVASRAVWIGNDETHYIRRHEDKDITDLKRLIDVTVRWIETECMTLEAEGIPYKR